MVRLAAYGTASCALAGYVVFSAFRQRSNFFSAAVYLSKSNACMLILWNMGVFLTILFGRALQGIFFGPLRLLEVERLHERAWYAVTESLLALTIFRDEFDTSFVILFVSLLFFKVFHWLAADRVEMMEQSPSITRGFYIRMTALLSLLLLVDLGLIIFAATTILTDGPSVMIMFASEYMILQATLIGICCKFLVNWYDLRSEIPWENKSVYTFYIDLAVDFVKLATYLGFFGLILTFYGLPLNILRDVYITARSFVLKIRDLSRYRTATRNMDERYPTATAEDMERAADKTCIICREDMEIRTAPAAGETARPAAQAGRQGPNDTPKKLPCGHIFHFHCLRSWLERQQSCPTCRRNVITTTPAARPDNQAGRPGDNPPAAQPGAVPRPGGLAVPGQAGAAAASATADPSRPTLRLPRPQDAPDNPLVAFQACRTPAPVAAASPTSPTTAVQLLPTPTQPDSSAADTAAKQRRERMVAAVHARRLQTSTSSSSTGTASPSKMGPSFGGLKNAVASESLREAYQKAAGPVSDDVARTKADSSEASASAAVGRPSETTSAAFDAITPNTTGHGDAMTSNAARDIAQRSSSANLARFRALDKPPDLGELMMRSYRLEVAAQADAAAIEGTSTQAKSRSPSPTSRIAPLSQAGSSSRPSHQTDMPRLIPMHSINGGTFVNDMLRLGPGQIETSAASPLPAGLDDRQLGVIDRVTKEALDSRLQLLQSTQAALVACTQQLQQAMSALSAGDVSAVAQIASEINASSRQMATAQSTQEKGKGREVAEQAVPP